MRLWRVSRVLPDPVEIPLEPGSSCRIRARVGRLGNPVVVIEIVDRRGTSATGYHLVTAVAIPGHRVHAVAQALAGVGHAIPNSNE